jgi:hypothetical protein
MATEAGVSVYCIDGVFTRLEATPPVACECVVDVCSWREWSGTEADGPSAQRARGGEVADESKAMSTPLAISARARGRLRRTDPRDPSFIPPSDDRASRPAIISQMNDCYASVQASKRQ